MSKQPLKRKLIEVSLPLEAINRESAREKSIRHGHPSTLHLWWARRPLATARAVLFAQLVNDPSSNPEEFPTEEAQQTERERLHKLIERLVVWDNTGDEGLLAEAREEILKSTDGDPPPIFDPFAGGGTIPLEAQRLGLEAHASDLNPVAVLINKALIEIPPKFAGMPPVFPGLAETEMAGWKGAAGLAADVRAYGEWMGDKAEERIGTHYPKAELPGGGKATVIAWIWARTVRCPNPACGIEMPLVRSWWLSKKKGREAYVVPRVVDDPAQPSGQRFNFEIAEDRDGPATDGTMSGRRGANCPACGSTVSKAHIKAAGIGNGMGARLMALVTEAGKQRIFLPPTKEHERAAELDRPDGAPDSPLATHPQYMGTSHWGLTDVADLFTNRQLTALTTLNDLVGEVRRYVLEDTTSSGALPADADAYADAVITYLGLCASKMAVFHCSLARWRADAAKTAPAFGRQALAMVWDFAESMPFAGAGGDWIGVVDGAARVLEGLPSTAPGSVRQVPAQDAPFDPRVLVSTDPPYYDNVPYADLSDFFYVWLRQSLQGAYPELLGTMLVPKYEELVANHLRQGGKEGARQFFEAGFRNVFMHARGTALGNFPITVYYAFKQSESSDNGEVSPGWETLLDGMIQAGWAITATWPVRSESSSRLRSHTSNALASSIVLALRPRPRDAPTTDRRGLLGALQLELPEALRELQQGAIAPVDLPQAAIGPGMAVFSRYSSVIEADGSQMTVRSALERINEILDQVLNEQEGDFDSTTRFAIAWYRQHGYGTGKFGDANNLANARNTTVDGMARGGILASAAGNVTLFAPTAVPDHYDPIEDEQISAWEVLHHMIAALDRGGIDKSARLLSAAASRAEDPVDADLVKELAFLLFSLAEKNGWAQDALAFNTLATSWPEILDASRDVGSQIEQASFDLEEA